MDQNDNNRYQYYYSGGDQPIQDMKPSKKPRLGLKITALALICALLGGALGGGLVFWGMDRSQEEEEHSTELQVSDREITQVSHKKVDGNTLMSEAEVYQANIQSVVSINTTATAGRNFLGQPVQSASSGSGFVLTKDGYIATNYHVVKNAETVKVTMYDGKEYEARYIGGDESYDIAVIKVEGKEMDPVTLGDSSKLNVGDRVMTVGNPLGELTFSMSGGFVSSVNRAINVSGTPFNMIQTDASINPGNSGGPLFNLYGEVVGIVSAKYSSYANQAVEGLGFAIPMNDVAAMIEDIMTNGYVTDRAYLGITPQSMTEQMAAQFRYEITSGVFVCSVEPGSAAERAGLQMGDVIVKVDDQEVKTVEELNMVKKRYGAGDQATLTVYRDGKEQERKVTWDAAPAPEEQKQQEQVPVQPQAPGQPPQSMDPWELFDYFFGY